MPSPLHVYFGEFEVDESNALLRHNGNAISLSPTLFELLCVLLRQPGSLLTKNTLLDQVWGHRFVSDSVLKGAISDIRKVLGDDPRHPCYIETVPRRGYRFIAALGQVPGTVKPPSQNNDTEPHLPVSSNVFEAGSEGGSLFVGRAIELSWLRGVWNRAVSGNRAIAWIAGEPGIGKTTLIEHFVAELGAITCVRGQCVQHHGPGEPYLPVLEALAELCRHDPKATALLRTIAPTWLLQMPWLNSEEQREALLHELVGVNPQRMLREMSEFMDRYTEHQPLLLITEDLHWGDRSTIQLIDYMARRRGNTRLMWLSSFRLTEIIALDHPLNTLRHELRAQGLCDEVVLDSFSETEVAAYVAARVPMTITDERLVRALHERTGGVPLFITSITRELIDQSVRMDSVDIVRLASTIVPESLSGLIDYYITRFTDKQLKLLTVASVCGMELRIDMLSRILECDTVQITEVCDELSRERLWLSSIRPTEHNDWIERSYTFRHTLFRQHLYDRTVPGLRAKLHYQVGRELEQLRAMDQNVASAELAMHFDRGRSPMAALRYYAEAAQAAMLHLSPTESLGLTERGLAIAGQVSEDMERQALEITLATLRGVAAFHTLGAGDEARSAYLHASSLLTEVPRHPMAGLALHGLGFLFDLCAEYPAALAIAERAEVLAAQNDDPLLKLAACAVQGQVLMMQGHHVAAREGLERALPMLEQANSRAEQNFIGFIVDPQVTVLAMLSLPLTQLGLINQAGERLQQAYTRARLLAQPMALMVTIWCDTLCEVRRGDVVRVGVLADEMQSLVDEFALTQGKAACRWFRGWVDAHCGRPADGFRRIREACEENRSLGMISGGSEVLGYAAEALILQGDWEGAQKQLNQAFDIVNVYGERIFLPQLLLIQAAIQQERGELDSAEVSIRQALREARTQDASWVELLLLTEFCEHGTPTSDDCNALVRLVDQLAEANETNLLARARRLVQSMEQDN